MGRRFTPIEEIDRLSERLMSAYPKISNRVEFDLAFDDYMQVLNENQDKILRNNIWKKLLSKRPNIKDARRTTDKQEKIAIGEIKFDKPGKVKNKVVFSKQDFVRIKNTKVIVYRDRKGRFVKVKR